MTILLLTPSSPSFLANSCMESDPVKIAVEGVETFKKDNCDLIVVDTSAYLIIEDIRQVYEATVCNCCLFHLHCFLFFYLYYIMVLVAKGWSLL